MDLRDAADAFVLGWTHTRRLSGPFEALPLGEATWLHDPTGRRAGELVGVDLGPERLVWLYPGGRGREKVGPFDPGGAGWVGL